ncbi:MAG: hypothetical protein LBP19_08155 [Treponema sp.]|jgi:uncharacterized coiled-coil protein SlyX|nr:hypothetical protein [Treponema sp.]
MTFQDILIKIRTLSKDKSKSDFEDSIKEQLGAFGGEYEEKVNLLLKAVNAGYFDRVREASEHEKTIQTLEFSGLIQNFQDKNSVTWEKAAETVSYLAMLLGQEMPSIDAHRTILPVKQLKKYEELEERLKKIEDDIQNNREISRNAVSATLNSNTIEERLEKIESNISNIKNTISTLNNIINNRLVNLDACIKTIEERLKDVEYDIQNSNKETRHTVTTINKWIPNIESRIKTIEVGLKHVEYDIQNSNKELINDISIINTTINNSLLNLESRLNSIEESMRKSEFARPNQNQENITLEIRTLTAQIQRISEAADKTTRHLTSINTRVKNLEDNANMAEPVFPKKISEPPNSMSTVNKTDTTISAFNAWAANPGTKLPNEFYYLEHDMRVRREQPLTPSAMETKWISNKNGSKKYLFPNPNSFDQMTDIKELYNMDLTKLRSKGQNKIRITEPCEMSGSGFINYPGELTLL